MAKPLTDCGVHAPSSIGSGHIRQKRINYFIPDRLFHHVAFDRMQWGIVFSSGPNLLSLSLPTNDHAQLDFIVARQCKTAAAESRAMLC